MIVSGGFLGGFSHLFLGTKKGGRDFSLPPCAMNKQVTSPEVTGASNQADIALSISILEKPLNGKTP